MLVTKFATSTKPPREIRERTFAFVASTESVDADGDVLVQSGWKLNRFAENPVVLAAHDGRSFPVATVGKIEVAGRSLRGEMTFPPEGTSDSSDEAYRLVKAGVLRALSVGFRSISWEPLAGGGRKYTEIELLEISLVSVPSNEEALLAATVGGKVPAPPAPSGVTRDEVRALLAAAFPKPASIQRCSITPEEVRALVFAEMQDLARKTVAQAKGRLDD